MSILNTLSLLLSPALAVFFAIAFRSKLNSKDSTVLVVSFCISLLTVIPSLVIKFTASELGLDESVYTLFGRIGFSAFTSFVDELNKYIVIIAYAYRRREFDEPYAGILICIMIGLGFVTVDNAWHILNADKYSDSWRVITSIPLSICTAVLMGYYTGLSKYGLDSDDISAFGHRMRGLITATFYHGFYNFFLFMEDYNALGTLITIGSTVLLGHVALNVIRARRLHLRLMYSRSRRAKAGSDSFA